MSNLQAPRGQRDILPEEQPLWQSIRSTAEYISEQMGFSPITIPTYEYLSLFQRSIGAGTDVMDKELFLTRGPHTEPGKEEYALRPEATAGIARAYIEHGMSSLAQPVKLYTLATCFRYDRPQKGRYREHNQLSTEYLGDDSAFSDAWLIYANYRFLTELGLKDILLKINTLGTNTERASYIDAFVAALTPHKESLSKDSQYRLEQNPLRILDSKDAGDQELLKTAPKLSEHLGQESKERHSTVLSYLKSWGIPFEEDPSIVRGLDYYCHTTFEWFVKDSEGQQSALGGGGRYDGLIPQLGGPTTPAVGSGLGLDRIMEAIQAIEGNTAPQGVDLFVIAADAAGKQRAFSLITELFEAGFSVDAALDKEGVSSQLKVASKHNAEAVLILGEQEISQGIIQLKVLETGEQQSLTLATLTHELTNLFESPAAHPGAE